MVLAITLRNVPRRMDESSERGLLYSRWEESTQHFYKAGKQDSCGDREGQNIKLGTEWQSFYLPT